MPICVGLRLALVETNYFHCLSGFTVGQWSVACATVHVDVHNNGIGQIRFWLKNAQNAKSVAVTLFYLVLYLASAHCGRTDSSGNGHLRNE